LGVSAWTRADTVEHALHLPYHAQRSAKKTLTTYLHSAKCRTAHHLPLRPPRAPRLTGHAQHIQGRHPKPSACLRSLMRGVPTARRDGVIRGLQKPSRAGAYSALAARSQASPCGAAACHGTLGAGCAHAARRGRSRHRTRACQLCSAANLRPALPRLLHGEVLGRGGHAAASEHDLAVGEHLGVHPHARAR